MYIVRYWRGQRYMKRSDVDGMRVQIENSLNKSFGRTPRLNCDGISTRKSRIMRYRVAPIRLPRIATCYIAGVCVCACAWVYVPSVYTSIHICAHSFTHTCFARARTLGDTLGALKSQCIRGILSQVLIFFLFGVSSQHHFNGSSDETIWNGVWMVSKFSFESGGGRDADTRAKPNAYDGTQPTNDVYEYSSSTKATTPSNPQPRWTRRNLFVRLL